MDNYDSTKLKYVAIHEIGHCLGLAHNQVLDVMFPNVCNNTYLSPNDKASYDAAALKY